MKFFPTSLQLTRKIEQVKLQGMFHVKHPLPILDRKNKRTRLTGAAHFEDRINYRVLIEIAEAGDRPRLGKIH